MPTVRRIRVKGLKGKFRVTLYAKEGTYALSVPKSRLGHLLLPVARAHPFEVRLKSPVSVDVPRGVRPVGKAARRSLTYTPLRPRKRKAATPAPKIEEVTSGLAHALPAETTPKRKRSRKKAVATAA
jgi:hypothetical protein